MTGDERDYEVGYGRPPKSGRFSKGRSGNPAGRPKGSKNFVTMFNEIGQQMVTVTSNGQTRRMTRFEAMDFQLFNKAVKGDHKAYEFASRMRVEFEQRGNEDAAVPHDRDKQTVQNFLKRMKAMGTSSNSSREKEDEGIPE